jgi:hypothetical protein
MTVTFEYIQLRPPASQVSAYHNKTLGQSDVKFYSGFIPMQRELYLLFGRDRHDMGNSSSDFRIIGRAKDKIPVTRVSNVFAGLIILYSG